jgi:hypothetical protein
MSFIDSRWEVWDNKALTATVHSFTAENFFDLEEDGVTDESISSTLWLNIQVGTAAGGMASGAYFAVLTSDSVGFNGGGGAEKCIAALGCADYPLMAAELTAKARFSLAFPRWSLHKYLEVYFKAISEAATGLTVDVWFGLEPLCPIKVQKLPSGYA